MEKEVVSQLLMDVSKIKVIELEPEWFLDKNLRYIVEDIKRTEGDDSDVILMAERIKENHPDSVVSKDLLFDLATNSITNSKLEKYAKEIKIKHLERKVGEYSSIYAKNPSLLSYQKMKDAMIRLEEEKDVEEEDGDISEAIAQLYDEMENGTRSGIHTYQSLDAVLGDGVAGGMLITIGARTGVGKTTFGVNLAVEAMRNNEDVSIDFYSLEMTKKEMLKKFVSRLSEINSYKFVNTKLQLSDEEKKKVIASSEWLEKRDLSLLDNHFDVDSISRAIRRRAYSVKGKYIAFVDYLQLISGDTRLQRYLQIGEVTRKLKRLTNELDIPIIIFSQINRGVDSREDKMPTLSDLRESGDIEQDSNAVIFLAADKDDESIVNVRVAKNRAGKTATIPFRMFKQLSLFEEDIRT